MQTEAPYRSSSNTSLERVRDALRGSYRALDEDHCFTVMEKQDKKQGSSWTPLLVLSGIVATLGSSMPVGYNIGVMNTPQLIIKSFCNESVWSRYEIEVNEIELNVIWSSIVSIFLIGGMIGSLSGSWLADKWGRKGTLLVNYVLCVLAAGCFLAAPSLSSVELLLVARFLVGIAGGLTTSMLPMYLTEIAPLELRGAFGTLCPLGITFGLIIAQVLGLKIVLGTPEGWHYLLALYAVPILVSAAALPFLPESPKYLYIVCQKEEKGAKELSRLRGVPVCDLESELESIKSSSKRELEAGKWSIGKLLKSRSLRWSLVLVCCLQAGQQLSGINAVFYYSVPIFLSAGLGEEGSQYASIGAGVVNFVVAGLAMLLANKCSRRKLMFFSCATVCACLTLLIFAIYTIDSISWMPYFSIAMVLSYVFFYGVGLGPIPYFIGSELFSVGPRPAAMALGSMCNWLGNFIVGMTFTSVQAVTGAFSFVPFIVSTALLAALLWWKLPETLGVDPTEQPQNTLLQTNNKK